jgi:iron complex transport system substrate-binding protein
VGIRIVSLLPSATEICVALGLGESLVGVSHECDRPGVPVMTRSFVDADLSSAQIDAAVRERVASERPMFVLDEAALAAAAPDLILTQDTCAVCAIPARDVESVARSAVGDSVRLVSLAPRTLDDVFASMRAVAQAADVEVKGEALVAGLRASLANIARQVDWAHKRVAFIEWLEPPMMAGHWTCELIRIAGGEAVGGHEAAPTVPTRWDAVRALEPELAIVCPCGFSVAQTRSELARVRHELGPIPIAVIDGNAFFHRAGPRLVKSAELAQIAIGGFDRDVLANEMLVFPPSWPLG